ncbi:MAG: tRNA preQ1(34) S-adenosylmethionine ribosyltransferase-isomerase QueA [Bdellovibrionales bacterium]|nr:tRNA preQ1(34) S-adenosylmethionine ribosyltransferase-isomerase QueA [Bdellovibrionales bacterium]
MKSRDLDPSLTDRLEDYAFDLPEELIAQDPAPTRESARLLVVRREPSGGMPRFEDLRVSDLPALIASEPKLQRAVWVRNRSRVIPARFYARRPSGGRHEIVLLEEKSPRVWTAIVRNQAAFHYPQILHPEQKSEQTFTSPEPGVLDFSQWPEPVEAFLEAHGEMPLPPYIRKRVAARDRERYQTVWARSDRAASVAAPTASLHFTPELCRNIESNGGQFADIVLHVGLGTFEPVRSPTLSGHELHAERIEVEAPTLQLLRQGLAAGRPRITVGTTALRTLESLSINGEPTRPGAQLALAPDGSIRGKTQLFVRPSFEFRYTNALFTNFHLPASTLFVLVACFAGSRQLALEAYEHAIARKYRFFSFGDASLWL